MMLNCCGMRQARSLLCFGLLSLTLLSCTSEESPPVMPTPTFTPYPLHTSTPTQPSGPTNTPVPTPTPTSAPLGLSRQSPAPIGTAIRLGGWQLVVNSVMQDATAAVIAENRFNDPPEPGRQFFIANLTATYVGDDESSSLFAEISLSAVGPSNVQYQDFQDSCGVIPNEIDTFKDVFQGGSITGNICWSVRTTDALALLMYGEESFSLDDRRVWWSLIP